MRKLTGTFWLFLVVVLMAVTPAAAQVQPAAITAIKAGRLIDPETGTAAANQVILIEGEKGTAWCSKKME